MSVISVLKRNLDQILSQTHFELEKKGFRELFWKGWRVWKEEAGCCSPCARKASLVAGTVLTLSYIGGAFMFGTLALQEAIEALENGEPRAPIIGHFAEWTMLGTFATIIASRYPYEIAERGFAKEVDQVFDPHLKDPFLTVQERVEIYREKLRLLQQHAQKLFFSPYTFPFGAVDSQGSDLMSIDVLLASTYQAIEKELNHSNCELVSAGFCEILMRKSSCAATLLKVSLVVGTILILGELGIYSIGIVESGAQGLIDYEEGRIPSIGGHSLEWAAEITAVVGTIAYRVFAEITNVGRAKKIASAFNKQIDHTSQKQFSFSNERIARLKEVRDGMIDGLGQGFLFSLPYSLRYAKAEESSIELEEIV